MQFKKNRQLIQQTYKEALTEFNRSLKLIVDIDLLKDYTSSKIKQVVDVEQVYFFLLNNELNRFFINGDPQFDRELYFTLNDRLIFWLSSNETYLNLIKHPDITSFLSERENKILEKLKIKFIYPLRVMNQTRGMVFLTDKLKGSRFKNEEIDLLSTLIDQASFAMENASLYQQQVDRLKRMYQADRMSIMGQLAAGAAHEIRNPLTSIRSTIQFLKRDITDPEEGQLVDNLIGEVDRINEIIQGLLSFSRPNLPQIETIDLDSIIQQTIQLISNTANKKDIELIYNKNTELSLIEADPGQLKQVFLNILINSIQAINNKGEVNISIEDNESTRSISHAIKEEIYIVISDSGTGIDSDNIDKIFDPFYTTKSEGTGLGLSISYGIINRHGGDIKIKSKIGEGTTVIISLPITPK
ncbi:MAG: histidine kinase [Chlorobi bacterium]|nr:histidine kinase [Chlorobiota bacterium]